MEGLVDEILQDVLTRMGGVDWCVTEFIRVSDRLLPQSSFGKLAPELKNGALTRAGTPVRVQLLGSDPICLADNAAFACTRSGHRPSTSTSAARPRPSTNPVAVRCC